MRMVQNTHIAIAMVYRNMYFKSLKSMFKSHIVGKRKQNSDVGSTPSMEKCFKCMW